MEISLMEAYIIESIKAAGYTYEQVEEQLKQRSIAQFDQELGRFDYTLLLTLYEQSPNVVQAAFAGTYRVKFLTVNGLKNLLKFKFGIQEEQYTQINTGLIGLKVDEETEQKIIDFVSANWQVSRQHEQLSITI